MKKLYSFFLFAVLPLFLFAQARIVLNGGTIKLQNGGNLVIQNRDPNAITVLAPGSGIVTDNAQSRLRWHIGTSSGSYNIPFKYEDFLIPLSFSTSNAVGAGYFDLSTYHVPTWKNSDRLPPGVSGINRNGADNSDHAVDRFWLIDAQGYTTRPTLSNLSFTYVETEWNATGNLISEPMLMAQRWNSSMNTWSDYTPSGMADATNNHVVISSLPSSDLFEWWTLVDGDFAMSDELSGSKFNTLKKESMNPGIRFYPNPVTSTLTIYAGGSRVKELQLIDALGRKLYHQSMKGNIQNINVSHLPSGSYILQLMKGEMKWSYKIIKQ